MDMKLKFSNLMGVFGLGIIGFAVYWYLIKYEDLSQFLAFAIIGIMLICFTIVFQELIKVREKVKYFDEMMAEEYDQRLKRK